MSVLSYGEFPSQQSSGKMHPSKGVSQFKAPRRLQPGVQSDTLLAPSQHYSLSGSTFSRGVSQFKAPRRFQPSVQSGKLPEQGHYSSLSGSTSSRGVSQFKTPLSLQSGAQSGTLLVPDRPSWASGAPPFNGVPLFQVSNPSQSVVQQLEKRIEQSGYYASSGMHLSNAAMQPSGPTTSHPRVLALPSVVAHDTYAAGEPMTHNSSVLPISPNTLSTDPSVGRPVPLSSLEAQRWSPQFLRASDHSWQPALSRSEARVRSEGLRRTKAHVTMKVILMGATVLLVGAIASFLLLRFPTYLVVAWAILIIVFSNLVSRELRSYYQLTPTPTQMEALHPSSIATPHSEDMGRHPVLKDISDTTGYLRALCIVFKKGHPTQTFLPEKEYRV